MLRQQRRIGIPLAITAFWLVMVGIFLYREYGDVFSPPPPAASSDFVPRDQWMGIYVREDHRVGYLHTRTREESRGMVPGRRLLLDASMETALFGITAAMEIEGRAWVASEGHLADFSFSLRASDTVMKLRGQVAGNRLTGTLDTGGETVPLAFPLDGSFDLGGALGLTADSLPDLMPGESAEIEAFDPVAMTLAKATVRCVGEEAIRIDGDPVSARIYETVLGTMTSRAWVGDEGEILQASTPFGFTLRKIDPDTLADTIVAPEDVDLIRELAIIPTGMPLAGDPKRLVVRVSGTPPDSFPHDPPRQLREGAVLTVVQPEIPGAHGAEDPGFDAAPYLASDPFVTASHPDVVARARAIVGEAPGRWTQAVQLHDWVFEAIEKAPVLSVPNALDVLRTRRGDCNEHTVLYTALARSLGIPTRIAIGLVYSEELGGFGYHAWPEVRVAGYWHPLDPTLGQLSADATHIKLLNGSISAWAGLAGFIGQVELEVIESE